MACIKTGAVVHFEEWGVTHVADVFQVGDAVVVNCVYDDFFTGGSHREATHTFRVGHGFEKRSKGVFVARAENFLEIDRGE